MKRFMKCQKNNNHKIAQKMQKQVKINRCTHNADERFYTKIDILKINQQKY